MLAKEVIFLRLKSAYANLLKQQVTNKSNDIKDLKLDCSVSLAYSLIKIYPWLNDYELVDWRDKVEEICDCNLPCVTCHDRPEDLEDFDPDTIWIPYDGTYEDFPTIWIPLEWEQEDNGITTTIYVEPAPAITTTMNDGICRQNISYRRWETADGPYTIEGKYLDCNNVEQYINFTKGTTQCISFKPRQDGSGVIASDPANQKYFTTNTNNWSIGIYPCL